MKIDLVRKFVSEIVPEFRSSDFLFVRYVFLSANGDVLLFLFTTVCVKACVSCGDNGAIMSAVLTLSMSALALGMPVCVAGLRLLKQAIGCLVVLAFSAMA